MLYLEAKGARDRFHQKGDISDIQQAIKYYENALLVQLSVTSKHLRFMALADLAECFQDIYKKQGSIQDLGGAIRNYRDALELCPDGHQHRPIILNNLASCLRTRNDKQGSYDDLKEAIKHFRVALYLRPLGHPNRFDSLIRLSDSLLSKYKQQASSANLEALIQCLDETPGSRSLGGPEKSVSLNGQPEEALAQTLKDAIDYLLEAKKLRPSDHPSQWHTFNTLANCLQARSQHDDNTQLEDLKEAIKYHKQALELNPEGNIRKPTTWDNLAMCLQASFDLQGNIQDLEEAIRCLDSASQTLPPRHPLLATVWARLATIYADYPSVLEATGNLKPFSYLFEKATGHPTASLKQRFAIAQRWIDRETGPCLLQAHQTCLQLADQYILTIPSITRRYELLISLLYLPGSHAASSAIEAGDVKKAISLLEQGRTLLWSQIGRYHTSLDDLKKVDPTLAEEFQRLSNLLESLAISDGDIDVPQLSMEQKTQTYRQITDDWKAIVDRIHKLDGFSTFLGTPDYKILQRAAENGPVIVVNINSHRCDAIIVRNDADPVLIKLPHVEYSHIHKLYTRFQKSINSSGSSTHSEITGILVELWDEIVEPIVIKLRDIGVTPGSRIWWYPTSELALLPLHAAGPHRPRKLNLFDIYISSYTSTLSALIRKTDEVAASSKIAQFSPESVENVQLLVVSQPRPSKELGTSGLKTLRFVKDECQNIKSFVPSADVLIDEQATHHAVWTNLQNYNWLHLACHGSYNSDNPFRSCFHLYDKPLTLLDIMQARLPDSQFAFLSACHSAAVDTTRPDEVIHLAAGLQYSGFQSVIGTMYAMADVDGPVVAAEVYKYMFHQVGKAEPVVGSDELALKRVECRDAAKALHEAMKILRKNEVPVERWINFVHIGV